MIEQKPSKTQETVIIVPPPYVRLSTALYALYEAAAAALREESFPVTDTTILLARRVVEAEAAEKAWWEAFDALPAVPLPPTPYAVTAGEYPADDSDRLDTFYSGVEK